MTKVGKGKGDLATRRMFGRVRVPLTSNLAECEVDPAAFEATQVYSPACRAATDSMVSCLTRFPELDTITSIRSDLIGWLSKVQVISRGESPLVTTHCTETRSPAFTGSSPNEIGAICGETASNTSAFRDRRDARCERGDEWVGMGSTRRNEGLR